MAQPIMNEIEITYYAVRVNGKLVTRPFADTVLAENARSNLSEDQQQQAEIVPVTQTGQEILLG